MPRPRKVKPSEKLEKEQQIADQNMREVENFTYKGVTRKNIPHAGLARYDVKEEAVKTYQYDPNIDPSLQWAGKAERTSFEVPSSSIHIHESIKPLKVISSFLKKYQSTEFTKGQTTLWHEESPAERMKRRRENIEFYQHGVDWTNRMIAGDSLVIMNSLLEREGMAGQVQMVYFDPPYGIKYGSNFQPFVDKRDVKDGKDEDLSDEPEMIKAFRDTWELGIHSYLSYIRDRLLLAHEILSEKGSLFVQIGDENLHLIRNICDEVFGKENFVSLITVRKTLPLGSNGLAGVCDYIVWYAKDKTKYTYHQLYYPKVIGEDVAYSFLMFPDKTWRRFTKEEKLNPKLLPEDGKVFRVNHLMSAGYTPSCFYEFELNGKTIKPKRRSWSTNKEGMERLIENNRVIVVSEEPQYVMYYNDFPIKPLHNLWGDLQGATDPIYVVQTNPEIVKRCMLMTTDPGNLVLDITCGSGTTAFVAEKFGRRWITCDTSRVAISLAKQRLMTASFDYYKLAHPEQGVGSGFVYKTVPHITLKSIAQNEPPATETLYDQPEIDKTKIRVTGPFTIEALPSPTVKPLEDVGYQENAGKKQADWIDQLYATGILGRNGERIRFTRIEPLSGTRYIHAEGETHEDRPKQVAVCFGSETHPIDVKIVDRAMDELSHLAKQPELMIFAGFQFDPEASKLINEMVWPNMTLLQVQMNTDLMTDDLRKKERSAQSFFLIGQPDVELIKLGEKTYKVKVNGFDYYNVKTGEVDSGNTSRIAMWMLDLDYDGMSVEPEQIFFPLGGKNGGWNKLAKTLRSEVNAELLEAYEGTESLPFEIKDSDKIAVKIIDDRGIESLKVLNIEE